MSTDPGNLDVTTGAGSALPQIIFTHGCPGHGPCSACGEIEELRYGCCFDCACAAEERAARRSVLEHLSRGLVRVLRGDFSFSTRVDFAWAWERLTKTGDYAPGGEFDSQYLNPEPRDRTPLSGPAPSTPQPRPSEAAQVSASNPGMPAK